MTLLVIDAQGGGIGKQLVSGVKAKYPDTVVLAVGTNGIATTAMLKAGADHVATGENAVIVGCRRADIIAGPLGIVIADSMLGEITSAIAVAIGQSSAKRIFVPTNQCDSIVAGVHSKPIGEIIKDAIEKIGEIIRANA